MTVVNLLRLNKGAGLGVADERESYGGRTYDVAKKLHSLGNKGIIGYSGAVPNGEAILQDIKYCIKPDLNSKQILNGIQDSYKLVRDSKFIRGVLDAYCLSTQDFVKLVMSQPEHPLVKLTSVEYGTKNFGLMMAVGLQDDDNFKIYGVFYPGNAEQVDRYISIGSGADRAQIVIGDALHHMQPEERENIPLTTGARILMEATRSAWRNQGVGGRSQVVWYDEKGYHELGNKESNLLNNALYFESKGKLEKPFVNKIFEDIIERSSKVNEIISDIEGKLKHKDLVQLVMLDSLQYD
jgi:hypothetical protein